MLQLCPMRACVCVQVKHLGRYEPELPRRCRHLPNTGVRAVLCETLQAMDDGALVAGAAGSGEEGVVQDPIIAAELKGRQGQCPVCFVYWQRDGEEPMVGCDTCKAWLHRCPASQVCIHRHARLLHTSSRTARR